MEELSGATDAYLVGSIVNGDREAVRPLVERYQKPLLALLRRALGVPLGTVKSRIHHGLRKLAAFASSRSR